MKITNEQFAEAVKLYKQGVKFRDIDEKTGVNAGLVSTAIRSLRLIGVDIPKRTAPKRDWSEVAKLL
jgi:3-hydroxyacyl-CoA dehydrogenase